MYQNVIPLEWRESVPVSAKDYPWLGRLDGHQVTSPVTGRSYDLRQFKCLESRESPYRGETRLSCDLSSDGLAEAEHFYLPERQLWLHLLPENET